MSSPDDPFRKEPPAAGGSAYDQPLQAGGYGAPQAPAQGYGQPQGGYPPPQGYGQPQGSWPAPYGVQETSGRAIAVLVCAIASFLALPLLPAVVALAIAPGARREIRSSGGRLGGEGLVRAGRIVAWINVALCVLALVAVVVLVVVAVSRPATTTGSV